MLKITLQLLHGLFVYVTTYKIFPTKFRMILVGRVRTVDGNSCSFGGRRRKTVLAENSARMDSTFLRASSVFVIIYIDLSSVRFWVFLNYSSSHYCDIDFDQ